MMMTRVCVAIALATTLIGCGDDGSSTEDGPLGGSLTVSGDVYDFQTGALVAGDASVSAVNLVREPTITVTGSSFVMEGVPENSAFQLLASVEPTHRATYSTTIEVIDVDVDGVKAYAVSEQLLADLSAGFQVTPSAANGVLLMQLVDTSGNPKAGVAASNIVLEGVTGASAPRFLDASLAAAPNATASSASGWVAVFEVPPGLVTLGTAANATATLQMAASPVSAGSVTLTRVTVTDGAPPALPTNVSFTTSVIPIFENRGCVACHSGGGPGKDLGGLFLDGGANNIYKELTMEDPTRVVPAMAEKSLLLTMPSAESPPDRHPNVTFTGPQDPDYVKILVWIREGAKNN